MNPNHEPDRMPAKVHSVMRDAAGMIVIAVSVYRATQINKYPFASLALFIIGLTILALGRRSHHSPLVARVSRFICIYAPNAIILTFVVATLADFGRYFNRVDFGMFYATALQLRTDPAHLYDTIAQDRMLALVTGGLKNHYLSFPYPPFVAALFVPLSHLSFPSAYYTMVSLNLLILSASLFLLCKHLCKTREQILAVALTAAAFLPVHINLILGQMAFVGLLLFSLFAIDILERRDMRAGLWVALLSYKVTLVPIALFILLLRRAWKGILVALSIMALLAALSLVLVGAAGMRANLHIMTMMTDESLLPRMQSLRALTYYLGMPAWGFWIAAIAVVTALGISYRRGGNLKWILAAAVLSNLLVSPYVQTYDLSLALVAITLAISSLHRVPDWKRAAFILLAFLPVLAEVAGQVAGKFWPVVPVTLLLLFCLCLRKAKIDRLESPHPKKMQKA